MNDPNKLTELDAKLDRVLEVLSALLAVAPRSNAEWYAQQTEAGQREVPTTENQL
jgi:hypothetical protein